MRKSIIYGLPLLLVGCAIRPITYPMKNISKYPNSIHQKDTLFVYSFIDKRRDSSIYKNRLFNRIRRDTALRSSYCYNYEAYYDRYPPRVELAKLLAEHLDSSRIFKKVVFDSTQKRIGYSLSVEVDNFEIFGKVNESAKAAEAIGKSYGMIGSLIAGNLNADLTSPQRYKIKYSNITLRDPLGNRIGHVSELISKDSGFVKPITYCHTIMNEINLKTKEHNSLLAKAIYSSLTDSIILNKNQAQELSNTKGEDNAGSRTLNDTPVKTEITGEDSAKILD